MSTVQINIALSIDSCSQAEILRDAWYPGTNKSQIRDAFIFDCCIDRFKIRPEFLIPIIDTDKGSAVVHRMITIKEESNQRLETIAAAIHKPKAATLRAIISYTINNIDISETPDAVKTTSTDISQVLIEKVALLEKQISDCQKTLNEIKSLTL